MKTTETANISIDVINALVQEHIRNLKDEPNLLLNLNDTQVDTIVEGGNRRIEKKDFLGISVTWDNEYN